MDLGLSYDSWDCLSGLIHLELILILSPLVLVYIAWLSVCVGYQLRACSTTHFIEEGEEKC